ncbi:hypothetical protein phytr_6160 [Candidatus Phycorickettsia trachydisci]|uniref:Uncharacterized protein n=1 Tax=Candidatus Phycorickettsia trachydisci TaxID=2115978 RepID=A0A2P1P8H0_9RICK|nr:hypothetical protein [Candidatus Phycorickettsia trachydisci]AVP87557.1 hypothetical protein phytr_6160 [Candidatus Phycorickettsia trachydisci]
MEEITNILNNDCKEQYTQANMMLVLKNVQNAYNLINPDEIDDVSIINAFDQEGVNLEEHLRDSILHQLPEVGHKSIFAVNTGGSWAAMVLCSTEDKVNVKYNHSGGGQMPETLNKVLSSLDIEIKNYQCKIEGGHDACGLKTIGQISEMIKDPYKDNLSSSPFHEHHHNVLIRIFDVLFSSSILLNMNPVEASIFLEMFYERHSTRDMEKLEANVKALYSYLESQQKNLEKQQELNKNKIDENLLIVNDLLNACKQKMPQITDHKSDSYVDQMCKVLLEQLKVASQSSETTKISVHQEDSGGGTEESKKGDLKSILIKKYNLGEGYEMELYQDGKTSLRLNGEMCNFIEEKVAEQIKGQVYENPHTHEKAGVLWMDGEPELVDDIETLGLIVVGHDNEA